MKGSAILKDIDIDKDAFFMCQEPSPDLTIEKANEIFDKIETEKDIADLFAIVDNKAWWIEDEEYDFEEGTEEYHCVISDELATYNELEIGDTLNVVNPNNDEESYELEVVGIYHNEQSGTMQSGIMGGFSTATDSANQIYMSYPALDKMLKASEEIALKELLPTLGG